VWNGSAWLAWFMGIPVVEPVSSNYSWINQGSGGTAVSIDTSHGGEKMITGASGSSAGFTERVKATPGVPFTQTFGFLYAGAGTMGLAVMNATPSLLAWRSASADTTVAQPFLGWDSWSNPTAPSGGSQIVAAGSLRLWSGPILWMRYQDNGTNRILSTSSDGITFIPWRSESRTSFLTATQIGYLILSTSTCYIWMIHDSLTTP